MVDDQRWSAHEREHVTAESVHRREHDADEKARALAVGEMNRRLDELNQLRGEVTSDRAQFIRVETHTSDMKGLEIRINTVEKLLDKAEGSLNVWRFIAGFLGLGGLSAVIWAIVNSPSR